MPQSRNEPSWLDGEDKRAGDLVNSGQKVNNPSARKPKPKAKQETPPRVFKGIRVREDYLQSFDQLVATTKHTVGKNGPDLMEEALDLLFKKYNKMITK